jgi:excisionase family DNA binding protein
MSTSSDSNRRWVSLSEAAIYSGVSSRTIRRMIANGKLTGYQSGSRLIRIDLNDLDTVFTPIGSSVTK